MRARADIMRSLGLMLFITGAFSYEHNFKITRFEAPKFIPKDRQHFDLICEYDADFTVVSWYKGDHEFFRYTPNAPSPIKLFNADGVTQIEIVECNIEKCHIRISPVTVDSTGVYKCELERSIRPFKFEMHSGYVEVEGYQPRKPILLGLKKEYTEGDTIQALCRAEKKSEIRWFLNSQEVGESRGVPALEVQSSRNLFIGEDTPSIAVQCAESKRGKIISSNVVKIYWKEPSTNGHTDIKLLYIPIKLIAIVVLLRSYFLY